MGCIYEDTVYMTDAVITARKACIYNSMMGRHSDGADLLYSRFKGIVAREVRQRYFTNPARSHSAIDLPRYTACYSPIVTVAMRAHTLFFAVLQGHTMYERDSPYRSRTRSEFLGEFNGPQ